MSHGGTIRPGLNRPADKSRSMAYLHHAITDIHRRYGYQDRKITEDLVMATAAQLVKTILGQGRHLEVFVASRPYCLMCHGIGTIDRGYCDDPGKQACPRCRGFKYEGRFNNSDTSSS